MKNETVVIYVDWADEKGEEHELSAIIEYWSDPNYGADADGNRGFPMSGFSFLEVGLPEGLSKQDKLKAELALDEYAENFNGFKEVEL